MKAIKDDRLKTAILLILVIPLLKPEGLSVMSVFVDTLFDYWLVIDSVVIFCWFTVSVILVNKKISPILLGVLLFVLFELSITLTFGGSLYRLATNWLKVLVIGMLVECCIKELDFLLKAMLIYLEILIYVNFILVIAFPKGMYVSEVYVGFDTNWLLGYKSSLQYYVFPAVIISLILARRNNRYLRFMILLIICHIETWLVRNVMLLAGLALFDICMFVLLKGRLFLPYKAQIATVGIANLVFLTSGELALQNDGPISWILAHVFGKSETILSRFEIWTSAIDQLQGHQLLGFGVLSDPQRIELIGNHAHTHNQVLQLLFESGILGCLMFMTFFFLLVWELSKRKDCTSRILCYAIFILFIMCVFEIFTRGPSSFIWVLIFISYYSMRLEPGTSKQCTRSYKLCQ